MALENIWQIAVMLSVRGLLGDIKAQHFDKELESILTAVYPLVVNHYIASWKLGDLSNTRTVPGHKMAKDIGESEMGKLRDAVIKRVEEKAKEAGKGSCGRPEKKKHPFRHLFNAICATIWDGNPDPDVPKMQEIASKVQEAGHKGLRLQECFDLLKTTLKDQPDPKSDNRKKELYIRQKVILFLIDAIFNGILKTITVEKEFSVLDEGLTSAKDFPTKKIKQIMQTKTLNEQKAAEIVMAFFEMDSLGLKKAASDEHTKFITKLLIRDESESQSKETDTRSTESKSKEKKSKERKSKESKDSQSLDTDTTHSREKDSKLIEKDSTMIAS
jgi:hypothetical protein